MNVEATMDIEQMTVTEKIRLMELLWRDISKDPENIPIPDWHKRILEERDGALSNGKTEYIDFEEAIADIRRRAEIVRSNK